MPGAAAGSVALSTSADQIVSESVSAGVIYPFVGPSTAHRQTSDFTRTSAPPVTLAPVQHPLVIFKVSGTLSSFTDARRIAFVSGLADILSIQAWQIVIRDVRAGSVIFEVEILRDLKTSVTISDVLARLEAAMFEGKLGSLGVLDLTIGGQRTLFQDRSNGISCFIGSHTGCTSQLLIVSNTQHRWDQCWTCNNRKFEFINVGGCFSNDSLRLLHPKCADAQSLCLNDGRIGSTYTACTSSDCNSCSSSVSTYLVRFRYWPSISAIFFPGLFSL